MNWNKAARWLLILALWGFGVSAVNADFAEDFFGAKPDDFVKIRTYFGALGISANINQLGDFSGTAPAMISKPVTTTSGGTTNVSNPEVDFIPAIERNFGWGLMFGHREGCLAGEISFYRSEHTANYYSGSTTFTSPASLQVISVDFKRYFFTKVPTQPFISVGMSFPWLWVRQFSFLYDPSYTTVQSSADETISGIGLNLGIGLEVYLGKDFSIVGSASRRWASFDQINGAAKTPMNQMYFDNNPSHVASLAGDAYHFYVGTTVSFE